MDFWVTGGAGFIGSALAKELNNNSIYNILIVDDLSNGEKFSNLKKLTFSEYIDIDDFLTRLELNSLNIPKCIFHQGAITNTMERDGKLMFKYNYTFSVKLFNWAIKNKVPFIYASSAAVYGLNEICIENKSYENPINVYGYSKLAFDNYVRMNLSKIQSQVVGLRYFNVYGYGEKNKGNMASTIYQFYNQLEKNKKIRLFGKYLNYDKGLQCRDFIYIDDVIRTIMWIYENKNISGIFNLGTGEASSFNEVAKEIILNHNELDDQAFNNIVEYIKFPETLKGRYQCYTLANMNAIKSFGFDLKFLSLNKGVAKYIQKLKAKQE